MQTGTITNYPTLGNVRKTETVIAEVKKTSDYNKFKLMADNRNLNLLHVRRLVESFKEQHLICPIVVNEKFEVIDGQHRLQASKETGMPIYYILLRGYGIKEVQRLNTNQKNWTKMDYLQMYCAEGLLQYLQLKKFMEDFPDFQIQASERILTQLKSGRNSNSVEGHSMKMKHFEEGKLVIPDIRKSYSIARRIMDFKPHYKNFARGVFVSCLLGLFESDLYNHKEMLHKLESCPIKLADCDKVSSYRQLLETIYNYKRAKENKVSFKYL